MIFSDKVYNVMKWLVCVVLPAINTLFSGIAALWGLDATILAGVSGTIAAINVCLGAVFGIENYCYKNKSEDTDTAELTPAIGFEVSSGDQE